MPLILYSIDQTAVVMSGSDSSGVVSGSDGGGSGGDVSIALWWRLTAVV